MPATVKTIYENQPEIFWGSYHNDPDYHYGVALEQRGDQFITRIVYVLTNCNGDDMLITPETLINCFTEDDFAAQGIAPSDTMDDETADVNGWYCIEECTFDRSELAALKKSSDSLGNYLSILLEMLEVSAPDTEAVDESDDVETEVDESDEFESNESIDALERHSFFDLVQELSGISELVDRGRLVEPHPFKLRLTNEALMGWESADENKYRK